MKSPYLKALLLSGVLAPASFAINLYDTAPSIGVPESHAIKYRAYATVGYDDNLNSSSRDEDEGTYTQFGVGASYSDQESATSISYNVSLGARIYDKSAEGAHGELFGDCAFKGALSHSFGCGSVFSTNLSMSYSPDMNISDSIAAAYSQGEVFRWSWNNAYSHAIDSRWSWTATAAYSGNLYENSSYTRDDVQYFNTGLTFSNRYSSLTTYTVSASHRSDLRRMGENSHSVYFNVGVSHSLSPAASLYATVGVQYKFIDSNSDLYPNFRFGYRREIAEGLSANVYLSFDNENIDTGYRSDDMYLSDQTLRSGVNLEYVMTHKVSFHADASVLYSDYTKHTGGKADRDEETWVLAAGMRYKFTKNLMGLIDYQYTSSEQEWGDYDRNRVSTGLTYTF